MWTGFTADGGRLRRKKERMGAGSAVLARSAAEDARPSLLPPAANGMDPGQARFCGKSGGPTCDGPEAEAAEPGCAKLWGGKDGPRCD